MPQKLIILMLFMNIVVVNCFQFYYPDFPTDVQNLTLMATGTCATEHDGMLPYLTGSYVQLIPDPNVTSYIAEEVCYINNRVVYNYPIPFFSNINGTLTAVSFNTSFQFQLITIIDPVVPDYYGMAFFISPSSAAPNNSDGGLLGLVNDSSSGNPFLALEFDTWENGDIVVSSGSHIGVDIGSLSSAIVYDTSLFPSSLNLLRNYTFSVWMSFNASSQEISVWMTNDTTIVFSSADPPIHTFTYPTMTTKINNNLLSKLFTEPSAFVGFSATSAFDELSHRSTLGVKILKWALSVDDVVDDVGSRASLTNPSSMSSDKPSTTSSTVSLKFIMPVVAIGVLLLVSVASSLALLRYIRKSKHPRPNPEHVDVNSINLRRYSYRQLQDCTHNFNEKTSLIGEGGFSRVYKGTIPDGTVVAIKRLKEGLRMEAEFATELKIISNIRHRNLLQLQGWSYENGEALLVYRFMHNGSLETYLYGDRKGTLDGTTRLRILAGVAAALEYLHCGLGECILHRDVKAANVLLTDDFEPVLGDFGLARLIKHNEAVTATRAGTPGFIAPEVMMTGKVTDKSDVYSFGVLMLEVASGSRAISKTTEHLDQHIYLVDWVKSLQHEQSNSSSYHIQQVIDPSILKLTSGPLSKVEDEWKHMIELALICCHSSPDCRPDMKYVSQHIQEIINNPQSSSSQEFMRPGLAAFNKQYHDYPGMLQSNQHADPFNSPNYSGSSPPNHQSSSSSSYARTINRSNPMSTTSSSIMSGSATTSFYS